MVVMQDEMIQADEKEEKKSVKKSAKRKYEEVCYELFQGVETRSRKFMKK